MKIKGSHTRENYDKITRIPHKDKIQCQICGLWYLRPLGHVFQRHGITAREYKQEFRYPMKRGVVGKKLHQKFAKMGKKSPSWRVNLLIKGRDFRFKVGHKLNQAYQWVRKMLKRLWS